MRRAVILIVVFVLLGGVAYRVYRTIEFKEITDGENAEAREVDVRVSEVKQGTLERKIFLTGDVEPRSLVTVYSKVSGEVEKLAVDVGDKVKKGALIARIEKEKLILQAERLEASLEAAEANLEKLSKDFERIKSLFEKSAVSMQRMDDIDTACKSARAQVKGLKAALGLARIQLADSEIYAPIGGTIAKKFIEEGDIVTATSQMKGTPLVVVVDMDTVKVVVNAAEKDIVSVKMGLNAKVRVDAYADEVFAGRVCNVSPVLSPLTRTAPVEIEITNTDHLLKPGMFARVELITEVHGDVLVLPMRAIIYRDGETNVFVVEKNAVVLREVTTGLENEVMVEIAFGLEEGEKVVVEGSYGLKNGDRVRVK
jgi:membrane fusion protein (multidrug efflux system)